MDLPKLYEKEIPGPSVDRLCRIYSLLNEINFRPEQIISSKELGIRLGVKAHTIRKDISYLGDIGTSGSGYGIDALSTAIAGHLGLTNRRRACLVGLKGVGEIFLQSNHIFHDIFDLIAGFDQDINTIETTISNLPLFPAYDIADVVQSHSIEIALMTVSDSSAQVLADRLCKGGIKGIINFAPVTIQGTEENSNGEGIHIRNLNIRGELYILNALIGIEKNL